MDSSKSLLDIGAWNLRDREGYKKCGILEMERQGTFARHVLGRWCHRFLIVSKGSKSNRSWCLYCYQDQFSKRAEAVYILMECLCVEEYIDAKNPDIMGFSVRFIDPNRKNLVFSCPSSESKEIWIKALQSGITESHNYSADSGFASDGSAQGLLIDPVTNQYVSDSIIRQSRYTGYTDIDDIDVTMADVKATESIFEQEREKEMSHNKTSVVENQAHGNDPFYMNMTQSHGRNEVNMATSGVGEDLQLTLGSSTDFLSVDFGSVSLEPSVCRGTQETIYIHTEDEGNTCLKTINESSDESSVDSTQDYENVEKKFHECEFLQDSKEEAKSKKWIIEQPIGTFIVRPGTTTNKELCVNTENDVKIYKISEKPGQVYLSEDTTFHTLDDLVNFYHFHDLPSRHTQQKLTRGYKSKK